MTDVPQSGSFSVTDPSVKVRVEQATAAPGEMRPTPDRWWGAKERTLGDPKGKLRYVVCDLCGALVWSERKDAHAERCHGE